MVTPSGLQYEILSEGTGEKPGPGDNVLVHYRGETLSGVVFDSSYERGEPLSVPLDMVIAGWSEGLRLTREGSSVRLYIPSDLAYGEKGVGRDIGPNELIIFDVDLITIIKN
jgi:FKBP-type peptidyl-prolyl cis-trans isomerase